MRNYFRIVSTLKGSNRTATVKSILDEAREEVIEQKLKDAKVKLKQKLTAIEAARTVVANLERELEVLTAQVEADISNV